MAFAGLRGSGSWGSEERPTSFREMILWLDPNGMTPLTGLMSKSKSEAVDDPEFNWWEETLGISRVQVDYVTGYDSTVNTVQIDENGLELVAGDILQVEKTEGATYDNELLIVSSITSDSTIVVKRGQLGSTAADASLANNAYLTKIGNAFEEGVDAPSASQRNPTKYTNYCQIFRTAVGITGTAEKTRARTGDAYANDKKRKAHDHAVAIEMAMMFGQAYEGTGANGRPFRTTAGLRELLTSNVKIYSGTQDEDDLLDSLYPVFNYNAGGAGDQRILLCGNGYANELNKIIRKSSSTRLNYEGTIEVYGMKFRRLVIPQGEFAVKTHPLMNIHGRYTNSAFIINPVGLIWRHLRDTRFRDNIQNKKTDSREGEYFTEGGLELHFENTMGYQTGLSAG